MKSLFALVLVAYVACFFSCGAQKSDPQSPIVGKWSLQQEHVVVYLDNVNTIDTVLIANGPTQASVQFNGNGNYTSSSFYSAGTNLYSKIPPSSANVTGTYTYSASAFTVKPGLAGWFGVVTGSSTPPTMDSATIKIISLNSSGLDIATTETFGITNGTGPHTYVENNEYYYRK